MTNTGAFVQVTTCLLMLHLHRAGEAVEGLEGPSAHVVTYLEWLEKSFLDIVGSFENPW